MIKQARGDGVPRDEAEGICHETVRLMPVNDGFMLAVLPYGGKAGRCRCPCCCAQDNVAADKIVPLTCLARGQCLSCLAVFHDRTIKKPPDRRFY